MTPSSTIHWRIDAWYPDLNSEASAQLKKFHEELLKFNKAVNLISVKTIFHGDLIHFADSIVASRIIRADDPGMKEIYDFGSGNGFPGIVFGILFPEVNVVLVDSDERKCEFLKHVVNHLSLRNISVKNMVLETLPQNSVKCCMARGYANISKAILSTRKIVPKGGVFYHLKGENWSTEVGEIPTQLCSVWTPSLVQDYKLPIGEFRFAVVKTEKIA